MKIYIETYGCTLNQADGDLIQGILRKAGHHIVLDLRKADVVVLNTCTVKGATENKILKRLERLKDRKIIVTGCLSINEKRVKKIKPNLVLLYPGAVREIEKAVQDCYAGKNTTYRNSTEKEDSPRMITSPITRIPIQEGCVGSCYFCQTKFARPKLVSYKKERILEWIKKGIKKGAKEIQVTGMDSGAYGIDRKTNLIELLEEINKIKGDFKVRIGMINPIHVKRMIKRLIKILKKDKFYKFIHMPVQTGSERICKNMNRPHTVKDFSLCVRKIRKEIPQVTISTDIIVGYPNEKEKDFESTKELIKKIKPDVVNISKFTPRPGTKAKNMKQTDSKIVKRRTVELAKLCKRIAYENNSKLIGREYEVVITEKQKDWTGRNKYYKPIVVKKFYGKIGEKIKVKIRRANHSSLIS